MIKEVIEEPKYNLMISVAIPLLTLAVAWGSMNAEVKQLEEINTKEEQNFKEYVVKNDTKFETMNKTNQDMLILMTSMKKDIEYIKLFFTSVEQQ